MKLQYIKLLLSSSETRRLVNLSVPLVIGQMVQVALGIIDSIMVAKVGAIPLAACSFANSVFILPFLFGLGMVIAISPITAIEKAQGTKGHLVKILHSALFINLFSGVLIALILLLLCNFLSLFGQDSSVDLLSRPYLKLLAWSVLPSYVFMSLKNFIDGMEITKPALVVSLAAIVVNIIGNWVLIYGHWGFEAMGLLGAGWATLFTRVFMAVAMFIYFCYSPSLLQFKLWSISSYQISWSVSRRLLKMGLPIGAQYTFEAGAFSTAAIIIGWCGVKQLAAHQIVIGVSSLTFMMVLGLASAASIRIGEAVGLKETGRVREIANIVFLLTIVLMSITGILFFVLRSALPGWYIQDSEVIFWAKRLMIVAAFYQISDGLQCAVIGVLRGLEDVKVPTLTAVLGYWVVGLPIGYLLCFSFNLTSLGIWIGLSIGLTAVAVYLMYRFYYVKLKEYS